MCTSLRKLFIDLSKDQGNGMRDLTTSSLNKSLREKELINALFIKKYFHNIFLVQFYVDGIIFGCINKSLCEDFVHMMHEVLNANDDRAKLFSWSSSKTNGS